jgi:uncharacterized protein (UPF0332 family)
MQSELGWVHEGVGQRRLYFRVHILRDGLNEDAMVEDLGEYTMETDEQGRRWAKAKEKLQVAQLCYDHQFYGESAARSYYACYQAMWAVVRDPPLGLWRHGGLINEFCRGRWATPTLLPTALTGLRKKLESLHRLRIAVDYAADSVAQAEAEGGLAIVRELCQTIAHHTGWAL